MLYQYKIGSERSRPFVFVFYVLGLFVSRHARHRKQKAAEHIQSIKYLSMSMSTPKS
jgi:hypothetical protein